MISTFSQPGEHAITLQGPAGPIEAIVTCPKERAHPIVGVMCHPHSLHGGTMNNKVVTTIARMYRDMGIPSVRFNFRGVGTSGGEYDKGVGETEDLLALLNWVREQQPEAKIWLGGFSFGSYVAYRAASRWPIDLLLSIAPPVVNADFTATAVPTCPWIVVMGEEDEIVEPDKVFQWVDSLATQPTLIRMPGASHFFHGKLVEMKRLLAEKLEPFK